MDNSFTVRVDKVFGSLNSSSNSSLRSLWSLTGEEVEKREWNRDRDSPDREDNPCSSTFEGFFSKQRKTAEKNLRTRSNDFEGDVDLDDVSDEEEDDDDDNEDEQQGTGSSGHNDQEDWEVRSSIGLDCTLDREEEEDVDDKFAIGKEDAGDRLYMKDITDYGPYLNSHNVLPESFDDHVRDSRANHMAAKARLIEDEGGDLKSILKRKEKCDNKSGKRVRFDPACKDTCEDELESAQDSVMVNSVEAITSEEDTSCLPQNTPLVPDYIQNPLKYTRYTFDSTTEVDEGANQQAYMEFLNRVKSSKSVDSQQEESSVDLPKSVRFVPKKKAAGDAITVKDIHSMKQSNNETSKEPIHRVGFTAGIAAAEVQDTEASAMEEDEPETTTQNTSGNSTKKPRQYRSMAQTEEDGC
ncbi:midasin-like protein [Thalictrum thalictroides]|uniref:U5 small nuclear ribonucleoprotein TSSC4 n=1 Tax=Thalictrum thalictroides TaxID=46969 RepID=A0A7J6V308_THATH|nr:midasin-like protein [Thalictrum thalictroides]